MQIQKSHQEKKVQVKIGGDGAKFSHTSSFIQFSFSFPGTAKNVLSGYGKYCTQDSLIVFIHVTMCPGSSLGLIYVVVHYVTEKHTVYCGLTAGFLCFVLFFFFISYYNSLLTPVSCAHYKWFCFSFKETTPLQQ